MTYRAEVRDVVSRQFSCTCKDFRINGLGTCKHIEAVLLQLARRVQAEFKAAKRIPSPRADIVPDGTRLRVERNLAKLPPRIRTYFDSHGLQRDELSPEELIAELTASRTKPMRISQDVQHWLETRSRQQDRILSRRAYEAGVANGSQPEHVTLNPLFPYQREGMLHLAFKERALLADEMGLEKNHPGDRGLRASPPPREGAARVDRDPCLAEGRMGRANQKIYESSAAARVWRARPPLADLL